MLHADRASGARGGAQRALRARQLGCVFWLVMIAAGCSPPPAGPGKGRTGNERTLIIFAASSLTSAFDALADSFEAQHPGVQVLANYASSSTLAAQLAQGAQADVFASANERQMDAVRAAGKVTAEARVFAANRLVVVTPAVDTETVRSLADLAKPGLRLVLALPGVPARDYAEVVLANAVNSPDYGADFPQRVLGNLVSEEQNVRQVTAKIALGEADAAIVYGSDLSGQLPGTLRAVAIPAPLNVVARYPIAVLADTTQLVLAEDFVDFVLSPEGQAILVLWGLLPPPEA